MGTKYSDNPVQDPARFPAVSWYRFQEELRKNDGYYWHQNLERAGFTVWQVV